MPEIIRFFTGEEPILKNVPTWRCREPDALKEVLSKLDQLVVKEVGGSGGYGMLVGPAATKAEIEAFRRKLINDPDDFIAQPTLDLSTAPTLDKGELCGRHVDLRPFVRADGDSHGSTLEYRLVGVIMHRGSRNAGHYWAFVRTVDGNGAEVWLKCDDETGWLARTVPILWSAPRQRLAKV
jgi:uncharacterized circularly permuted ATP-grasp superfamily protein